MLQRRLAKMESRRRLVRRGHCKQPGFAEERPEKGQRDRSAVGTESVR